MAEGRITPTDLLDDALGRAPDKLAVHAMGAEAYAVEAIPRTGTHSPSSSRSIGPIPPRMGFTGSHSGVVNPWTFGGT